MNYIGVRGHRGSGKKTVSYLLGNTIEYILEGEKGDYEKKFRGWCDKMIKNENVISDAALWHVFFVGFGDIPRVLFSLLYGIPINIIYDDYSKDHIVCNIKDLTYKLYDYPPVNLLLSSKELYDKIQRGEINLQKDDVLMTLREAIMYFGREVMQRYFGQSVWVKSQKVSESEGFNNMYLEGLDCYKIYTDIKFPTELTYIIDNGGFVIKVTNPDREKPGEDALRDDCRWDEEVVINDDLYSLSSRIYEIAKQILNKNGIKK